MSRLGPAPGYRVRSLCWPEIKEELYFRGRESHERIQEACDAKADVRLLPQEGDKVFICPADISWETSKKLENTEATVVKVDRGSGLVTVRYNNPRPYFSSKPIIVEDTFRGDSAFTEP